MNEPTTTREIADTNGKLLTEKQLVKYIQVSRTTINKWRRKYGFPFIKIGAVVRYKMSDVDDWMFYHYFNLPDEQDIDQESDQD